MRVSFKAQAEDGAVPGSTAWNNFGYHYELTDGTTTQSLSAMSLDVGVQVPAAPELKKLLVDDEDKPLEATEDMGFTFVEYEGTPLSGEYATQAELIEALGKQDPARNYRVVTVPVELGKTESDVVYLTKSYMNGEGVKQDGQDDWAWTDGGTYTIVEVGTAGGLTFKDINKAPGGSYQFTYRATKNVELEVTNEETIWTLNVHKVDGNNTQTNLSGAVFALYSLDESDKLAETEYIKLLKPYAGITIDRVVTFTDATQAQHTGYLVRVGRTGADGTLSFTELERDSYYLLEVQAPDGYNLPDVPGTLVSRDEATAGVLNKDINNFPGYDLPSTGGPGTTLFTLGGVALMGAACIAGYRKRSRKGDGPCC